MHSTDDNNKYYVYVHVYKNGPKKGKVFYVGKGTGRRFNSKSQRNRWWNCIYNKYGFTSHKIVQNICEETALHIERELIKEYRIINPDLCNISDGGQGTNGVPGPNMVPVHNSMGMEFDSISTAGKYISKENGVSLSSAISLISQCISGRYLSAYRMSWAKVGENIPTYVSHNDRISKAKGYGVLCSNGEHFNSCYKAAEWIRKNGFPKAYHGNISQVCRGERYTAYGYKWKYVENEDEA